MTRLLTVLLSALFLMLPSGPAKAMFTFVHICHDGGPPLRVAIYKTYQGIFSDYSVSGWYRLENRDCISETLDAGSVRAYAFATFDDQNRLISLEYDVRAGSSRFGRSTRLLCVPVAATPAQFDFSTPQQQGSAPPCRDGHVAIPVSLNIRAGDMDEEFRFRFEGPTGGLPPPDPDYARIMAERFAPLEPEPALAPPPPDTPAFLSGKKLIEDLGPDADRIARYCEGLTYPMDVWNGRNPARTAFCPIWIEWRAAADAHDTHMQAIVAYRRQCRPASVARSWISYDPIDIAVRWPVIAIHAVRGGSYHSWRCGRIRDNLQSMTNGHLEKNVTGLARSVHDALFVQNVIQHFK